MVNYSGAKIKEVSPGSIGDELELEPGDLLLRINNTNLLDFIDYLMLSSEGKLNLEVLKGNGELLEIDFEKDPEESLGLVFEDLVFDKFRVCNNRCLFCFVHQLPEGLRRTLYVQDDDYRLSFLQGSYITLTNLTAADWKRIEALHLSPLYISVHATDPAVRQKLFGSKKPDQILHHIQRLADAGITIHTQAVICPNINDGNVLEQTIDDLAKFWPFVASLAIVPVGLTGHRKKLFDLRIFEPAEATTIIAKIVEKQSTFFKNIGTRLVFPADEWYVLAGLEFPSDDTYEGYPQLDNGVGLMRWFLSEFTEELPEYLPKLQKIRAHFIIITGESTKWLWPHIQEKFKQYCPAITIETLKVKNKLLGSTVTVTGLLGGMDIGKAIQSHASSPDSVYLIPQVTLKQDQAVFIDDLSILQLKEICKPKKIEIVPTRARDWLKWLVDKGSV